MNAPAWEVVRQWREGLKQYVRYSNGSVRCINANRHTRRKLGLSGRQWRKYLRAMRRAT